MKNSSGTILIMVLILSAIMFLIASTLLLFTMTEVHISDFEQRSTQAFYAAESSVTLGLAKLRTNIYHRTNTSEIFQIGANLGTLNVLFYEGRVDENGKYQGDGHYRKSLMPSFYRIVIQGKGVVSGLNAETIRTVERNVVVKPFVLFARRGVTVSARCKIIGKIHGNDSVSIDKLSTVKGDVTSNGPVTIGDKIFNDTIKEINDGTVDGTVSSLEPQITLPPLPIALYLPQYCYNGTVYNAKPLIHDTIPLSPVDGIDPPAPSIEVYSGFPDPDNPAGVFYPDSEITGVLTALQVEGTVVIPPTYPTNTVFINGAMTITPVDNFPALLCAENLKVKFIGNLKTFSKSLKKSRIQGLIYALDNVFIAGNYTTGEVIQGSIFGENISIAGNPILQITYDTSIISNPSPGIDLIEIGEWKESFE